MGDAFDPMGMMARLADGSEITNSDLLHLRNAAKAWMTSSGDIPIERCLRLPQTPEKYRISQRNRHLCEAIKLLPEYHRPRSEKSNQAVIDRLESEWNAFASRGMWRACRDDSEPPKDASPISRCLFFATSLNRGETLTARQIKRHVGHVFHWKCP